MRAGQTLGLMCFAVGALLLVLLNRPDSEHPSVTTGCKEVCRKEYGEDWASADVERVGLMTFRCVCRGPYKKFIKLERQP